MSNRMLTKYIKDNGILVSQRTLQGRLTEFGLMARKQYRKSELTKAMVKQRFASQMSPFPKSGLISQNVSEDGLEKNTILTVLFRRCWLNMPHLSWCGL
ncbi:hypothetical protein CEXT_211211 [Caerostris extrusa]|uniref:Transposase n=1 Tax=Caerostris extrusa TaxID=172846 RepID=A0AAV4NEZ1_CAEEX|nr:hypothetical protein CEXT_211211 [Caerostris extrusa]